MPFKDNKWEPNHKQALFLSLPLSIKEGFYGGGANSGKSEVLLAYPLIHRWHEHPQFKMVFMRRTFPELRAEIVPRSREFYLKFGAKLNKTEMTWTFPREDQYGAGTEPNGAMIFLAHCENEDDVHKYDSMEINLYAPDELTSYTEWIYKYIGFTRVRTSVPELPSIIRAAGMPGGVGHTWVKERFVKPYPPGSKILIGKGGNKRVYIHSTLSDNPYGDPNYSQSLDALPEAERNAKKFGSWDSYLGQVFEEFRDRKFPDEPENALHVIDSLEIPSWWPKIIAMDWGYAPPAATWIGYFAITPDRRVILFDEDWFQKTQIEDWCARVKPKIDHLDPKMVMLCQSAAQARGQEHTIEQQISAALDRQLQLTGNSHGSRVAGKMLLHEYLRWKPKFSNTPSVKPFNQDFADWLLRNKTEEDYRMYIEQFNVAEVETNIPKFLITRNCVKAIEAIRACNYKKDSQDVEEFPGDDAYDGVRYGIDAADGYFDEATEEMKQVEMRETLSKQYKENLDMTAFYRNARKLEADEDNKEFAVSRFHSGKRMKVM